MSCLLAVFASLQLDWATMTAGMLGLATSLQHKDGCIPLSVFHKDTTSKLGGLFSRLSLFVLSAKQENYFLSSFGMTRLGK